MSENMDSTNYSSPSISSDLKPTNPSNSTLQTPKTPEFPQSLLRLWRLNAHRNLRNQWSKLSSLRHQWASCSNSGRSHATSLVNTYLSIRYMDEMDLGVLSDMPIIRKKACSKLLKQQELQRSQLVSSYKAMVAVVLDMMNSSRSMRCFVKATSGSSLIQFSDSPESNDDMGDGGGAPVMTFLPISAFEMLAEELVEMFKQELYLKRLLVLDMLSVACQKSQQSWTDELYHGEAFDLRTWNLYTKETGEPCLPKIYDCKTRTTAVQTDKNPNQEVLQVYLTTWLAEVNIDTYRVEEIFATVGEEMGTSFS